MSFYDVIRLQSLYWNLRQHIFLIGILVLVSVIMSRSRKIPFIRVMAFDLALFYLLLVIEATVLARTSSENVMIEAELFWSWKTVIRYHDWILLKENVLNILMLMPIGLMVPFICDRKVGFWSGLLLGSFISFGIEISQLLFKRGLFEWDDIIHNALGCMVGVLIGNLGIRLWRKRNTGLYI